MMTAEVISFTPTHYTDEEGGMLKPWTAGEVKAESLASKVGQLIIEINGIKVHSLHHGDGSAKNDFIRWDAWNGFTDLKQ